MSGLLNSLRRHVRPYSPRPRIHQWLLRRPMSLTVPYTIVSFTFDDFPRSALHVGGRLLKQYNARGTYYASLGLMGTDHAKQGPCFTREDVDKLIADGHELGCHTYAHVGARQEGLKVFEDEIRKNRKYMEGILPGYALQNFAYPGGELTLRLKQRMRKYATSSRGTYVGVNRRWVDLDLLLCQNLHQHVPLNHTREVLAGCRRKPGWVIFYGHDVCDSPSLGGCTPEYLEDVLRMASDGCRILTVRDALALMQPM